MNWPVFLKVEELIHFSGLLSLISNPKTLQSYFIEVAGYFENIGKSKQNSFFKD